MENAVAVVTGSAQGIGRAVALRRELGEFNICVNCITQRLTRTEVERSVGEPGRHDQLLEARPAVQGIVHSHADDVIPFSITGEPLRPVLAPAKYIGTEIPVWDSDERFGDATDLLVNDMEKGRDLAYRLGQNEVALMRGAALGSR